MQDPALRLSRLSKHLSVPMEHLPLRLDLCPLCLPTLLRTLSLFPSPHFRRRISPRLHVDLSLRSPCTPMDLFLLPHFLFVRTLLRIRRRVHTQIQRILR